MIQYKPDRLVVGRICDANNDSSFSVLLRAIESASLYHNGKNTDTQFSYDFEKNLFLLFRRKINLKYEKNIILMTMCTNVHCLYTFPFIMDGKLPETEKMGEMSLPIDPVVILDSPWGELCTFFYREISKRWPTAILSFWSSINDSLWGMGIKDFVTAEPRSW